MNKKDIDRKEFLRTAGSVALFATLGIAFKGCDVADSGADDDNGNGNGSEGIIIDGNTIILNLQDPELENLRSAGGWMLISAANTLVVNIDGDFFRAFSSVCPHAGCADSWQYANSRFRCTCHNSIFENNGTRVSGPATSDLTEFQVARDNDTVTITRS